MNTLSVITAEAQGRFWEIDALRGCAIVMMVVYHLVFDLAFLGIAPISVTSGGWRALALATATLFLVLVGISFHISSSRAVVRMTRGRYIAKFISRGLFIFGLGIAISIISYLLIPSEWIVFGILHLIGLSICAAPLFRPLGRLNILLGSLVILAAPLVSMVDGPLWMAWLGIHPPGFSSLDYTPVFPFFGIVLIGIGLGPLLYPAGERRGVMDAPVHPLAALLTVPGRHSLLIYLIHQPALLAIIGVIFGINPLDSLAYAG